MMHLTTRISVIIVYGLITGYFDTTHLEFTFSHKHTTRNMTSVECKIMYIRMTGVRIKVSTQVATKNTTLNQ